MGNNFLKNPKLRREFILYTLCAGIATAADWLSFRFFYSFFSDNGVWGIEGNPFLENAEVTSVILSYTIGGISNYTLNKIFTYRDQSGNVVRQAAIYIAVMAGAYGLTILLMHLAVKFFFFDPMISRMLITGGVFFYNFLMHRQFTFNKKFQKKYDFK